MLRFLASAPKDEPTEPKAPPAPPEHPLDALTGGAFSAPTSGERAARVRSWLATSPSVEHMSEVFKELSHRDKGAAKPLKEKLDELRRSKGQESVAAEWAAKAQALLDTSKLNIADAMAWQRDAAKAGAPLSKPPLAEIKQRLMERVKIVEDLEHRVSVQREAAVLLAQRCEVLSTKPARDAAEVLEGLGADVAHWQTQALAMREDAAWSSVDAKFPPLLDASKAQLLVVWEAFTAALALAQAAAADPAAPLPPVPVWADAIRAKRAADAPVQERPVRPKADPAVRASALAAVGAAIEKLTAEVSGGHAKAIPKAAGELRSLLKEHHAVLGAELEGKAHAALGQAGELEGWQRWRTDQLREEMVAKAQALNTAAQPLGGRKLQEALRHLREQWKQLDLGGPPNHVLWKRFDEACTTAYARVEAWLETIKAEEGAAKEKRQALIDELRAWAAAHAQVADAKAELRELHAFAERWRDAGHLGERAFEPLHAQWKLAVKAAHAPIEGMQQASIERRKALIAQAVGIAAEPFLRIDAVRQLQQRWQQEAQAHPVDRKLEQKLWEQFRGPIDEAFNKKSAEREKAAAEVSERDRAVLDATKALDAAVASGDASKIRAAMADLEQVHRTGAAKSAPAPVVAATIPQAAKNQENTPNVQNPPQSDATDNLASDSTVEVADPTSADAPPNADSAPAEPQAESPEVAADAATEAVAPAVPAAPAKPAPKPVVAMRGDDRPGGKRAEPAAPPGRGRPDARGPGRPGAPGRDARPGLGRPGAPSGAPGAARPAFDRGSDRSTDRGTDRRAPPAGRDFADAREPRDMAPRLGDVAFHAQRDALERAQLQLKKLAGIAHGEAISGLMDAWTQRNGDLMPSAASLGKGVSAGARTAWVQAVSAPAQAKTPTEAILRLEMAAEVPTPAAHINERRVLQLQLLTRRNDPAPVATWAIDARAILSGPFDEGQARRLQAALKVLMR